MKRLSVIKMVSEYNLWLKCELNTNISLQLRLYVNELRTIVEQPYLINLGGLITF